MTDIRILILLLTLCSCEQKPKKYFEGVIKYKQEYTLKSDQLTYESAEQSFAKTIELYIKDCDNVHISTGGRIAEEWTIKTDSGVYIREHSSETYRYLPSKWNSLKDLSDWNAKNDRPKDSALYILTQKKETILGILCDELIIKNKTGSVTFYFNNDTLNLCSDWYANNRLVWFNHFYVDKINSIYLKLTLENKHWSSTRIATSIEHKKLDPTFFQIPKDKIAQ